MSDSPLLELLADLRRRLLLISGLSAFAWGMLAAIGVFLFGAWGDLVFDFPGGLRIAILLGSVLAAAGLFFFGVQQARRRGEMSSLARRLDATGNCGGEILAGADLMQTAGGATATNVVTRGLAAIAVERAIRLAEEVPEHLAVPSKPLKQAAAILAGALAACGLVWLIAPRMAATEMSRFLDPFGDHPPYTAVQFEVTPGNLEVIYGRGAEIEVRVTGDDVERVDLVLQAQANQPAESLPMFPDPGGKWKASVAHVTQPMKYHVRSGHARSPNYQLNVITVPKLEAVRFEITPPEYTQRPAYRGLLPSQGLAGLPGTIVRFWGKSNRPLSGGEAAIATTESEAVSITPVENNPLEVTGQFTISAPGKLKFAVIDRDGQKSEETFTAPIVVLKDGPPAIRLVQPREVSFATPSAALPVILSAEDDYGISQVEVFRSLNDSRYTAANAGVAAPPPTRWQSQVLLPLDTYGLAPGDVLKVFARVEDNRPEGAQGGESEIATIRIIAQEDFDRLTSRQEGADRLQAKYQQARRRLEGAANELEEFQKEMQEKAANGEEITADDREKMGQLANRLEEEAEALEYLLKKDELPYDLDKEMAKELGPLAEKLREMAQELRKRKDQENETAEQLAQELSSMQEELQQERQEFDENVTEPLETLAGVLELMKDQARFEELYEQQASLAERLSSLKNREGGDNPPLQRRMRDLEAEQERVRQELEELLEDIETHAAQLPEREELEELRNQAQEFAQAAKKSGAASSMSEAEMGLSEFSGAKGHAGAKEAKEQLEKLLEKSEEMAGAGGGGVGFKPSMRGAASKTLQQLMAEAGMMPGQGQGRSGSGGGYSARRNSLSNVGLYGGQPELEKNASKSMKGSQDRRQQGRFARQMDGSERGPGEGTGLDATAAQAGGRAEAQAPATYRRRVAAYFERVVEELND